MTSCAFITCSNNTRNTSKSKGVTFHSFPTDTRVKEYWVKIVQQNRREEDWVPTKYSRLCTAHFTEDDIVLTPLLRRKIRATAVPFLVPPNITKIKQESRSSSPILHIRVSEPYSLSDAQNIIRPKTQTSVETKKKAKCKKDSKVKGKRKNTYLKNKTTFLQELLKSLEKKNYVNQENFKELIKNVPPNRELLLAITRKKKTITSKVRKFCLILYYYSPAAYKYFRMKCNNILPQPQTLAYWYAKRDGSPGFTQQAFEKLHKKSRQGRIVATLIVDEMALRQVPKWNGKISIGLVNEGFGPKEEVAAQAYVFMLVSNSENWKIPLGYFFVNGFRAEQRANLISICITKCFNVGVDVIALTLDGSKVNVAAAEFLGCHFENIHDLKTTFLHPLSKVKNVAVFFDPAHMLKLVRNTFEAKRILFSQKGTIEWLYLVKLQRLQQREDFNFENKTSLRYNTFRNEIMKFNIADELLSRSVTIALKLCSEMLTGTTFRDVEATVQFLETFSDLFDVFNSKKQFYKENEETTMQLLDEAENYIKSLEIYNKVKLPTKRSIKIKITKQCILTAQCKTGFLGFLVNIRSLKNLYAAAQKTKLMRYTTTNQFSLHHLQLFFGLVRQHWDYPTTEQFRDKYTEILSQMELHNTVTGNCLPLENFPILGCSSALQIINDTTIGYTGANFDLFEANVQSAEDKRCEENSNILSRALDDDKNMGDITNQIIGYISGLVVRKMVQTNKCEVCSSILVSNKRLPFHRLITLRNLGGLLLPAKDVYDICFKTESYLKIYRKMYGNVKECEIEALLSEILEAFIGSHVLIELHEHSLEQPAMCNHRILLIKAIIQTYVDVRLHYLHKNVKILEKPKLHKLILF